MHAPIEVLGAMITPAVLISAAALLLLSTASRLGRVNDRLQHLMADADQLLSPSDSFADREQKRQLNLKQLSSLEDRLLLLRSAVSATYIAIALFLATSIMAGMNVIFPQLTSMLPVSIGMLGAVAFLYSIALLIRESSMAARMSLYEFAYVRELFEQRQANGER